MGGPEQQETGSRKSAGCSFGGLQPKIWGGGGGVDTAMKGAGVDRLQLCCGVQGTPQEIGGQQQTGSRKSAAGIWGGCGRRKQRWHKVCCRGGGGGGREFAISEQGTGSRKLGGGGTTIEGAGVGSCNCAAGYRVQGAPQEIGGQQQTGCRTSAAGIWGGLCLVTEIFRGRALVAATVLEGAGYTTGNWRAATNW